MKFIDSQILDQLKDIAIDVSKRRCKNRMGQMFCTETYFLLKKRYYNGLIKNKSQNLEIL